jgi:hypothetical protein
VELKGGVEFKRMQGILKNLRKLSKKISNKLGEKQKNGELKLSDNAE